MLPRLRRGHRQARIPPKLTGEEGIHLRESQRTYHEGTQGRGELAGGYIGLSQLDTGGWRVEQRADEAH